MQRCSRITTFIRICRISPKTGGCVADSLEMRTLGHEQRSSTLVICGVRFMGETAKILNPEKRVLMPDLEATCSLDLGCSAEEFVPFCDAHPDRARGRLCEHECGSQSSSRLGRHLRDWVGYRSRAASARKKLLWAPDRHLGNYVQHETGADMLIWQGACVVHDEFKGAELQTLKEAHPNAKVLVHPESPESVIRVADVVGCDRPADSRDSGFGQ